MPDPLLMGRPHVFERGDKVYLTTPLTLATPTEAQVEEFAFASAVKSSAPNEHIGWLSGRYVEAGRANLNGAMWLSDELAIKALTPMLMPVTVMHDPRTAVGTIADCKLQTPEEASQVTARIDTILAIWKHRFGPIWEEAQANIKDGTMMQSMECFSPWYCCSECGQQFIKLSEGKEQSSWCAHLQTNSSRRILGDVCFTGTGLIFGTRGGKGAYTEAYLDHFKDEIAEYHEQAHVDSTYRSSERGSTVALVQIEESELATLRRERDDNRSKATDQATEIATLTTKVETAEAAAVKEKARADAADAEKAKLEEKAQAATLKDKRLSALGTGFLAKLGEFTRERLGEAAASQSDDEWEATLKEKEEMAGVKRDLKDEGKKSKDETKGGSNGGTEAAAEGTSFSSEELASFSAKGVSSGGSTETPSGSASLALARSFAGRGRPKATETAKQ